MTAAEVLATVVYTHRKRTGRCSCGEHLRAPSDSSYAKHLADVQLDALKAAGYEVVALPEPKGLGAVDSVPYWSVLFGGEPEDIYPLDSGEVRISGFDDMSVEVARCLAAALLAAANAAEASSEVAR